MRGPDWKPSYDDPEVQQYLRDAAGDDGVRLFRYVLEHEPITGVEILEAYEDRPPSQVRKVLYKLMESHALEYHKDTDAKGWETFHWHTDLNELKIIHQRMWADELQHLRKQLKFEQDHEFYGCNQRHRRMIFEDALDLSFRCPVCSDPMDPVDNTAIVQALQERIDELTPVVEA